MKPTINQSSALLIIDLQNDFCHPNGSMSIPNANSLTAIINQLSLFLKTKHGLVIASKDWHPINHISFAVNHNQKPFSTGLINGINQKFWPKHCIQSTWGSQFVDGLNTNLIDIIIYKGTDKQLDSYSAFLANDRKTPTNLNQQLIAHNIKVLFICGVVLEYCVQASVLDAINYGYSVYLVTDACGALAKNSPLYKKALQTMEHAGAKFITSHDILSP